MKNNNQNKKFKLILLLYYVVLFVFIIYFLLDTFTISKVYKVVNEKSFETSSSNNSEQLKTGDVSTTTNTYEDDNIKIAITEYYENNTKIYVADIQLASSSLLKTALANNSYGKNVTEKTSTIASTVKAILAINGDFYGAQESGYVIKNGTLYRNTKKNNQEDLVIYKDGSFEIVSEDDITAEELLEKGAYNVLSFGPALIENDEIKVTSTTEVAKSMTSNPRTAIEIIDKKHYVFVVSDGRTTESKGLTLYQLATFMKNLGVKTAYNLDGGGSSTMYFNGKVINNPTTNGNKISERSVSDIVYIGY